MEKNICICGTSMEQGAAPWHYECIDCGYEKSTLQPKINISPDSKLIDEKNREKGLSTLRKENFTKILQQINKLELSGNKLLDIGSAHGWFLESAQKSFDAYGIEPDNELYNLSIGKSLKVRNGYSPEAITFDEKYDVIVFNDVFEHIPNIEHTLSCCNKHLNSNGLLVLNLPSSKGIVYLMSKIAYKIGIKIVFEQCWQKDLPSPHLHYFDNNNLTKFLNNYSFTIEFSGYIPTIKFSNLYKRIRSNLNIGLLYSGLIYFIAVLSLPFLKFMPKDIIYIIARKK